MLKWVKAALVSLTMMSAGSAWATENFQWSSPTGILFFGSGMLPPATPGGTFGLRSVFAYNSSLHDQSGHKIDNNFGQFVNVTTPSYIRMMDIEILGAKWGFLIAQPIMTINGGFDVHTPRGTMGLHDAKTGFADTTIEPFLLQWHFDDLFINTGVAIQPPVGSYSTHTLFNPGNNYWTFGPHAAVTYISPSGFEASSMVRLDFNTTNPSTHYHTGTELKIEAALGQHFGDFTVGPVGVLYQQIQDDSAASLTSTVRSRVYSAGLSVNFMRRGFPFTLQGTLVQDFGAESHTQGTSLALRGGWTF